MKKLIWTIAFFAILFLVACNGQYDEAQPTTTTAAKELLNDFTSIFFGPFSATGESAFSYIWMPNFGSYVVDAYDNQVYDVPFVRTFCASVWNSDWYTIVVAYDFSIFTTHDSHKPLIISIRFSSGSFSGGGHVVYKLSNDGSEFLQLGSMIGYHWGGPGPAVISLTPFMSESGDKIVYAVQAGSSNFYAIGSGGDFEVVAFLEEGFAPMVRMYDLEWELTEAISQNLYNTLSFVEERFIWGE
ncbi:MAG: hypothetical protein FWB74_06330 [Defluviitaleaceae bacterium]|nr:hypothetical protein [Defluviitaleaceae bacterium]